MIELTRISLVQWHLLSRADLDLAGDAAILGQNRSGKSTLIDLIQAVMTGGSGKYHRFNKSAGEGGGRSERTLKSYSLGQLNEDTFLRPAGSWTHIALTFEDRLGTRPPVTLGLCIEASLQHGAEVVGRYIAPGVKVDTSMFIEELGEGRTRSAAWSIVRPRLSAACAAADAMLAAPDGARDFVREYMRRLFTANRTPEPERFLRAFVMALSFQDRRSVEEFVTDFLLERKDIDIRELRESIERYREVQRTIRELGKRLDALKGIEKLIDRFVVALEAEETARATERLASMIEAGAAFRSNLLERAMKSTALQRIVEDLTRVDAETERQEEELASVRRQLAASGAAGRRAILELEMKALDRDHAEVAGAMRSRWLEVATLDQLLEHRDRLAVLNPGELIRRLEAIRVAGAGLSPPEWPADPAAMDRLLEDAGAAAASRLPKAEELRADALALCRSIGQELNEAEDRLRQAKSGRIRLEQWTLDLMDLLQREGMAPRTVCDVTEVVHERWRGAVEALFLRDREAILVDPEHASRAISIMRHRQEFRRCRVVNTRKLAGGSTQPRTGTLAAVLKSDDQLATAFIVQRIGNVALADDQEQLLAGGRAVMDDGTYYDGLVTEMRQATSFKIGLAAAPLMEASLGAKVEELRDLVGVHDSRARFFEDIIQRLRAAAAEIAPERRLDTLVLRLSDVEERRKGKRAELSRLAATIDPALLEAETRALQEVAGLRRDHDELIRERADQEAGIRSVDQRLGAGDAIPGSRLSIAQRRKLFRDAVPTSRALAPAAKRYRSLRPRAPGRVATEMAQQAAQAREEHRELASDVRLALGRYSLEFPDQFPDYATAPIVETVKPWVSQGVATLEGNELIRYQRQADEAADRIARLFRTNFIHELNSRFALIGNEIAGLRAALGDRPLHGEIYSLHATVRPEYEDLKRLAEQCERDETMLDALFGRAQPKDEAHARALAQVERLFGDEQLDFSMYEDYRRYFVFDLRMKDVATGLVNSFERRRGTGSGAERQVPFYVVIGAALASIYHGSRRSLPADRIGVGLAVFDEAFSKMDGQNQRALLNFYDDIGLQVLIAAPTEKRAVVYENLDSIIDVFRSGNHALAESVLIKDRARLEMRSANPQHLSDDALGRMLEDDKVRAAE